MCEGLNPIYWRIKVCESLLFRFLSKKTAAIMQVSVYKEKQINRLCYTIGIEY